MEKIITVKQEPIDDAYPTPPSTTVIATSTTTTTTTTQNVTTKITTVTTVSTGTATTVAATAITASPETQIFFIQQPKPEAQKPQCTLAGTQGWCGYTCTDTSSSMIIIRILFDDCPIFNNVNLRCWWLVKTVSLVVVSLHFHPCLLDNVLMCKVAYYRFSSTTQ